MALSKPTFLAHIKVLSLHRQHHHHRYPPPHFLSLRRQLSAFATPEDVAAERRKRKRRLRIEPPLSSLRQQQQTQPISKPQNPNTPKLPESVSALFGKRLELHNKILKLVRENDLEEAALYTRHSVYSYCKPTIYTVNAVLNAQLRQSKYADLLSLYRFTTHAAIAPNVVTYNLVFRTYLDCRRPDTTLEYYKLMIDLSPINHSPTTYRILSSNVDHGSIVFGCLEWTVL
ncbi:hypothetical protein ACFE04_009584 [Oxalis oulophora]